MEELFMYINSKYSYLNSSYLEDNEKTSLKSVHLTAMNYNIVKVFIKNLQLSTQNNV